MVLPPDFQHEKCERDVVAVIPAAGWARRIAPLPCSKEIYPVGFYNAHEKLCLRPKAVGHYLLEKLRLAKISKAYIVLRNGKWDIPAYFGDGKILDMHVAYLMVDLPFGVPYTLNQAFPFVRNSIVAFGFPDIIFKPDDAFIKIRKKQEISGADVVLGLFPAKKPENVDMVVLGSDGRVIGIQIKPAQTDLIYTWNIAVWTPLFTNFMHELILKDKEKREKEENGQIIHEHEEISVGDIIHAALKNGIKIESVIFPRGVYLDIGTPENLIEAVGKNILCLTK